jgi:cell division septation protein DedD
VTAVRGRRGSSRAGTFLVLVGIVGVLSVTFVAGLWTGRNWPVIVGDPKSPVAADASTPKARGAAGGERPRPTGPLPTLTFYQDLKAPLTAPPPPPPRPAKARPEPKPEEPPKAEVSSVTRPEPPAPASAGAGGRFTVQVAAYNVKPLAEALRTTLAAAGHDARVIEAQPGRSVRYLVQVGAYSTREAAREAASRLATERSLPTFVTTR